MEGGGGDFWAPNPWAAPKKPILNRVNLLVINLKDESFINSIE